MTLILPLVLVMLLNMQVDLHMEHKVQVLTVLVGRPQRAGISRQAKTDATWD